MTIYAVNKVCRRTVTEPEFREQLRTDAEPALRAAHPPLSEEEVQLILAGDVAPLARMGANCFLLHMLGRYGLFGLTLPEYARRIRQEYAPEREGWAAERVV
jgi:hypothetical protein